ncbi:MAG: T9SS type A sorting domain-containing protein [Saprospiraceae bacterium]|nr:T9SS type A sorting domain-containing protein [Saprospiraceae bacterium]MCF8249940.1 T9SS type A sorting domain-containing protein [Saprospiraceae bacterium]MCF8279353.1 T9SS type A sorting domain-containing protein [Bacteroidales bacterium]MCF8310044.1 T9SS type A sorting domain-containing protein [Saprospiraceae bacterium]MCF8438944.1 T9SS type A sorting domain-containing protein [Saprospiraceae bacterium]
MGTTTSATADAAGTCVTTNTQPGVWYTYIGNGSTATLSLCGTAWDTKLSVYTGGCAGLTCVTGNDDFCGLQSQVTFATTLGTTYHVLVHQFSTTGGAFTLAATSTGAANDLCANATPIGCGQTVSGTTRCANVDGPGLDCGAGSVGPDVWYTIVGNGPAITASLCGSSYDTQIDIYTGTCGALVCVIGNDDFCGLQSEVTWTATAGTTYYIRVHGFGGASGDFTLAMMCAAPPPDCVALPTSPANGQGGLCPSATTALSWPASAGANDYDVYFGTTNPPPFVANVVPTTYNANTPTAGTYFWQVRPHNGNGTATACAVWSFTKMSGAYTVPANGASQVACPALVVQPAAPPSVVTNCGTIVTPTGPTIVNSPSPITCEGTRTYTWTYNNGFGQVTTWNHVVTVERQPFGISTPNGAATVACPDQTDSQPAPPVVTSNCGEVLAPVITSTAKPTCEGARNWNFTYTDCEGNVGTWSFTYTVEYLDFVVPASEVENVECPLVVVAPIPPVVKDNCGKTLTPTGLVTSTNNASGCEGSRVYSWTYTDCEGNTHTWSKTFNFSYSADFFVYPDGELNVGCLLFAVTGPVPPTIYGICGEEIGYTGPVVTESIDPGGCSGVRKYTFTYTDCGGHSHPWSFTYIANDNEPPVGNCGGGSANSVDVTNLACIEDVPCPGDYDFGPKIQEMIAAGNIYDLCSGDNINVDLDSWSALWQCSDTNGNGVYTFGRTFYFRISDQCGNEMPSLCGITYSGVCQPLETFLQGEWGNEGGEPGISTPGNTSDLQTIATLLAQGPLTIGGSNRSLTLTDAQCVLNLVPGVGAPTILGNCIQTNCNGCNPAGTIGLKNSLATNTISMMLNMRFNVQYHGLTMTNIRNQGLGCIDIDPNIKTCVEGGGCKLHLFESDGTHHQFPYTLGGLLDLSNLFLDGNLALTLGSRIVYANAISNSITKVHEYWHNGQTPTTCPQNAGLPVVAGGDMNKALPTGKPNVSGELAFSLAPNPASNEVAFKLTEMTESQDVSISIYNSIGQVVLRRDFGRVSFVDERIDLSSIGAGLYIVSVKAGGVRHEQKLVIGK